MNRKRLTDNAKSSAETRVYLTGLGIRTDRVVGREREIDDPNL